VTLCAFDLLKLDGEDLRGAPIELRKATSRAFYVRTMAAWTFNQHFAADGLPSTGRRAHLAARASCRSASARHTGPAASTTGSNIKNPAAPAVKREAEEEWRTQRARQR